MSVQTSNRFTPYIPTTEVGGFAANFDKKYLQRTKQGNSFLFSPRIAEDEVSGRVLDRVFSGSTAAILLKLFDVKSVNHEELKELRQIIDRKLKDS